MAKSTKVPFTFESLGQIDGGSVAVAVNQEIRRAFLDMNDRPGVAKPRKITFSIELTPQVSQQGAFDRAGVKIEVDGRHPKRGLEILMLAQQDGLEFNPAAYDSPNQTTLNMEQE